MKSRTAYTRRDLLVALSCIVFLLLNLAAVGVSGHKRAKEMLCLSRLKHWGQIWQTYTDNNDGEFMENVYWANDWQLIRLYNGQSYSQVKAHILSRNPGLTGDMLEFEIVKLMYKVNKLRFCPAAVKTQQQGGRYPDQAWQEHNETGSYSINAWVTQATGGGRTSSRLWGTAYVAGAAKVPMFMDCYEYQNTTPQEQDQPPEYEGQPPPEYTNDDEIRRTCIDRHSGGINCLFLDFSARKVGLKQLWQLKWHRQWTAPDITEWPEWMARFKDYPPS